MSGFAIATFGGYLVGFTVVALGLYYGLRIAKII